MKILVVDDDPVSRRVLRQILASTEPDCVIAEAACGEEACALLERANHGFDVLFLDISMPDYDGLELLARFRRSAALKTLPVVLCTSSNDRATVIKAAAAIVAEKLKLIRTALPATPTTTAGNSATPFTGGTQAPFAPVGS